MNIEWKRRNSSTWDLLVDDVRKGTVVGKGDDHGNSYFLAYQGGKPIKPQRPNEYGGFCSLHGAKTSLEKACGVKMTKSKNPSGAGPMKRLEYLRGEILAERISYGEIAELYALAEYIAPDDTLLLEWADVPEKIN
jgi:hypothetical protein